MGTEPAPAPCAVAPSLWMCVMFFEIDSLASISQSSVFTWEPFHSVTQPLNLESSGHTKPACLLGQHPGYGGVAMPSSALHGVLRSQLFRLGLSLLLSVEKN